MDDEKDPYDKTIHKIARGHMDQVEKFYRGISKYYMDILRSMSNTIFNWGFALNTGGLAATIAFIGTAIKMKSPVSCLVILGFTFLMLIYFIGIASIVTAAFFEYKRFDKKSAFLEERFIEFNDGKTTARHFIKSIPSPKSCCDTLVPLLEKTSYILFFVGTILGVAFLICMLAQ